MRSMFEIEKLVKSNEMEKEQGIKNHHQKFVEKQLAQIGYQSEQRSAFAINPRYK